MGRGGETITSREWRHVFIRCLPGGGVFLSDDDMTRQRNIRTTDRHQELWDDFIPLFCYCLVFTIALLPAQCCMPSLPA